MEFEGTLETIRQNLVLDEVTEVWQTTPEIAGRLGVEWIAGGHGDLDEVRDDLYRLVLRGLAEQDPAHNGHRWRLKAPTAKGA